MSGAPVFRTLGLAEAGSARGVVVVIDVVRAFTTAAFAFAAGARRVLLVSTIQQAFALRERYPGALLMGEEGGLPIPGFDFWNSPAQFCGQDLGGRTLVQRTSAGTQGVVRAQHAGRLLAASFVVASATARAVRLDQPEGQPLEVDFIATGLRAEDPHFGRDDVSCAGYLAGLLAGGPAPDGAAALSWLALRRQTHFEGGTDAHLRQFQADLDLCVDIDRFPFAMEVRRVADELILEKRDVPATG